MYIVQYTPTTPTLLLLKFEIKLVIEEGGGASAGHGVFQLLNLQLNFKSKKAKLYSSLILRLT